MSQRTQQTSARQTRTEIETHAESENRRIPIAGLDDTADSSIPTDIAEKFGLDQTNAMSLITATQFFSDVLAVPINIENPLQHEDGSPDWDAIEALRTTNVSNSATNEQPRHDPEHTVNSHKCICNGSGLAEQALTGSSNNLVWNVVTNSYTVIDPSVAYQDLYLTLHQHGLNDNVYGWLTVDNDGGRGTLHLFIEDKQSELDSENPQIEDLELQFGICSTYDHKSRSSFKAGPIVWDKTNQALYRNIGLNSDSAQKTRRHTGDGVMEELRGWWETLYEGFLNFDQALMTDIIEATETHLKLNDDRVKFDIQQFYELLGISTTYSESAADLARAMATSKDEPSMWTLFYALMYTLENEYQGKDQTKGQYIAYCDEASRILRRPLSAIDSAANEYDRRREERADAASEDIELENDQATLISDHPPDEFIRTEEIDTHTQYQETTEFLQKTLGE